MQDKIDFIVNQILVLYEIIENIEDAFRNIVEIKLNKLIAILTMFSTFMLPLTFITSFYGMNIALPFQNNTYFIYFLLSLSIILTLILLLYLTKKS